MEDHVISYRNCISKFLIINILLYQPEKAIGSVSLGSLTHTDAEMGIERCAAFACKAAGRGQAFREDSCSKDGCLGKKWPRGGCPLGRGSWSPCSAPSEPAVTFSPQASSGNLIWRLALQTSPLFYKILTSFSLVLFC